MCLITTAAHPYSYPAPLALMIDKFSQISKSIIFHSQCRGHVSQNKILGGTFLIECHGFAIFCLKPLKTILDHPLEPLGAPDFFKNPPFYTVKSDLAILTWECFRIESVVVL